MRLSEKTDLLVISILLITAVSCGKELKSNDVPAWKDLYRAEVRELLRIGSDDLTNEPYVFSGISDLQFDSVDNVYVLDRREFLIKVFSPEGQYLKAFQLQQGQGPGELERPLGFTLDPQGNLYIADMMSQRIVGLDPTNNCIGTMRIDAFPGSMVTDGKNNIFITGGLQDLGQDEIRKYRFPDGKLLEAFCPANELAKWIGRVGAMGDICLTPRGTILYTFSIPYDIREFTPEGDLVNRFGRKIPGWTPPRISHEGLPDSPVMAMDISAFPDGKLLHVVFDKRTKPYITYFDVFDEHGKWLISFDTREFISDKYGRMARIDGQGNVYMEFWEPFPHIRKYSLAFVPAKS